MRIIEAIKKYFKKQKANIKDDFFNDKNEAALKEGITFISFFKFFISKMYLFFIFFIPLSVTSFVVGFSNSKTNYYSTGQLSFNSYVHGDLYIVVQEDLATDGFAQTVSTELKKDNVVHRDGSEITSFEIKDGLRTTHSSSSTNIFVYFYNTDSSITKTTVNTVLDSIVSYYDDDHDQRHIKNYISVGSYSNSVSKDINTLPFYIMLGTLGSLLIGMGVLLIYWKIKKTVLCTRDIYISSLPVKNIRLKNKHIKQNDIEDLKKIISSKFLNCHIKFVIVGPINKRRKNIVVKALSAYFDVDNESFTIINKEKSLLLGKEKDSLNLLIFDSGYSSMKSLNSISINTIRNDMDLFVGILID